MRNRYIIQTLLTVVLVTGAILLLQSNMPAKPAPGSESMEAGCDKSSNGKMIWEKLPQQFFSSF